MKKMFSITTAVLLLMGAPLSQARGTDQDGDGRFSKAEITQKRQEQLDKKFIKLDTNQDGQLTADELNGKKGVAKKADSNNDGVITKAEAKSQMTQNIDKYLSKKDTNKDGFVDKEERAKRKPSSDESIAKTEVASKAKRKKTDGDK